MRNKKFPGKLANVLAIILTLVMTLVLTAGCLTWLVNRVLTDEALHTAIALDDRVIDQQMARIENRVEELAQEQPFQVETVMNLVTRERVMQYNQDVIGWWMGLMQADPTIDAPEFDVSDIEQAVREDALFLENTTASQRRTLARDAIAYEVGVAVNKAVLPVRADILAILLPRVLEKVALPVYMNYLSMMPGLCGITAAVLALLMVLVLMRRVSKAALYVGAGLGASALCVAGVGLVGYLIGVPVMIAEISSLLAVQVSLLTKQMALQAGVYAVIAMTLGLVLISVHQADMKRLGKSWRSISA